MFDHLSPSERTIAIQRLTALWALNECGLGGFLHALQSPFTGLFVGSIAMICIAFICALSKNKWKSVMASLVIVLVIKGLVSPHSPPTAYIAVLFQAVTGAAIFRFIPGLLFSSILFFTLGLIESAIQRMLTLTILYGNTLWEAINTWGEYVTKQWGVILPLSSSRLIILTYLGIHFIAGIGVGWFTYRIIRSVSDHWGQQMYQLQLGRNDRKELIRNTSKGNKLVKRIVLFVVLAIIIVLAYYLPGDDHGVKSGFISVIRAIAILTIWFVFLAPMLVRLLQKWLDKKHHQLADEIDATMDMFPHLLWIIDHVWKETKQMRFIHRWKMFVRNTFLYILQFRLQYGADPDRSGEKP